MQFPFDSNFTRLDLPEPEPDALDHSGRLANYIAEKIESQGGAISFTEFMRMALYQPGFGYYSGTETKFGGSGDFVTAPEISALFGDCVANQFHSLIDQGCAATVLELGAGSGRLCAQVMQALPQLERYLILDLSADLVQRQQTYLRQQLPAKSFSKIEWLACLPSQFDGIVFANEVLDAMPVHLLCKQREGWQERVVGVEHGEFVWQLRDAGESERIAMQRIEALHGELPLDYCTELNMTIAPWLRALSDSCHQAAILLIDYGYEQADYYHPSRTRGTLLCHYRHRVHDNPLFYPGLQDITASVDFDAVADAAELTAIEPCGLVGQREFLLANGLLDQLQQRLANTDANTRLSLSQQVKTLSLPEEMGERFKVLALQKNLSLDWPAFRRDVTYG